MACRVENRPIEFRGVLGTRAYDRVQSLLEIYKQTDDNFGQPRET